MNETWDNRKKPSFGPDIGPYDPKLGTKFFFRGFYFH